MPSTPVADSGDPIKAPHDSAAVRNAILAGIVGNVLEWYDFAVYGYFAASIGRHFFPSEDPAASLIAAFGVFAAGFLMRPLGGLVFGHIGDKLGRNRALILSVLAMAVPTFLIGLLPGHEHLGTLAPVLLVILRMAQGLAVGGEFTTSIVFLVESAASNRRGFVGSWGPFGATAGILLGSAVGSLVSALLPQETIDAWGWRVPFLLGMVVGLAAWLVRRRLPEPPIARTAHDNAKSPILEAFRLEWRAILHLAALNAFLAVGFYLAFVYGVTWFEDVVGVSTAVAFDINTANMVVLLLTIPVAGALSDRLGRKPLLLISTAGGLLLAWPLFLLMHHVQPSAILAGQFGFTLLVGTFAGVNPAAMAEMLPHRVRCSALSVGYNLTMAILGGTTPMVATYFIYRTRDDLSPAFYLMIAAGISFAAVLGLRESSKSPMR